MKPTKIFWVKCNKFKKFVNPKVSYNFYKTFILSIICSKCGENIVRMFKEEESIEISKVLSLLSKGFMYV